MQTSLYWIVRILGNRLSCYRGSPSASIEPIREAAAGMSRQDRSQWVAQITADLTSRHLASTEPLAEERGISPANVCRTVQQILDAAPNAILVSDGGEFGQWAQAFLKAPRRIINGPSGAVGAAIPYAIGARLADPDHRRCNVRRRRRRLPYRRIRYRGSFQRTSRRCRRQ